MRAVGGAGFVEIRVARPQNDHQEYNMSKTYVTPYKLTLRRKWSKDEPFKLGDIEEIDCLSILERVMREQRSFATNDEQKTVYSLTGDFGAEGRFIFGRCELGEYGKELPIKNVKSGKISGKIKKDEAAMAPRFFMGYIPSNERCAIFLFESGTRGLIEDVLKERFQRYKIDLCPFSSQEAWEEFFKESMISTVTVDLEKKDITDNNPSWQSKKMVEHKRKLILSSEHRVADAFNDMFKPFLKDRNRKDLIEVIDIPNGYEAKEVLVKLRNSNEQRTVTTHFDRSLLVPRIVLHCKDDPSGHPTFESLFITSFGEIVTLAKKMNIDGEITDVVKNRYPKHNQRSS